MENYSLENYWVPRLGQHPIPESDGMVQGWSFLGEGLDTFMEAPLILSKDEFDDDVDPWQSPIILVSAPGAVGKTTLARQIAHRTGAVYVNLATAEVVGANTLSGGLARSGLYPSWVNGELAVVIDALDEAVLNASMDGFKAFLSDIAAMATGRNTPTVLFGRTGIVEDAWLFLDDMCNDDVAVLEIGFYDSDASISFAEARLQARYPDRQHPLVDREALTLLIDGLRSQTASDGDRFAGYAPVLHAVAERVASESNPSLLVSEMKQGGQPSVTLQSVVSDILTREQSKLQSIQFQDQALVDRLYLPDEQLDHLVARRYGVAPPEPPEMSPDDRQKYSDALRNWVRDHPFLDGDTGASSAVFEAVICERALGSSRANRIALQAELRKGEAVNPFLHVFYISDTLSETTVSIPEEHVGVVYASVRASLARGDAASLLIEDGDDESEFADVEIELARRGDINARDLRFTTGPLGPVYLGPYVKDVFISMPRARVEIGEGSEALLVAPVDIECEDLAILSEKVSVEKVPESEADVVFLQAAEYSGRQSYSVPATRNNVNLLVSWPGSNEYPWTTFNSEPRAVENEDPRLDEGIRRLRKFIVEFQSRGNKDLARTRRKIDSSRMTKGAGQAVLNSMLEEGIVARDQARYYLDVDRLAELTELTYTDSMSYKFGSKAIAFVQGALEKYGN